MAARKGGSRKPGGRTIKTVKPANAKAAKLPSSPTRAGFKSGDSLRRSVAATGLHPSKRSHALSATGRRLTPGRSGKGALGKDYYAIKTRVARLRKQGKVSMRASYLADRQFNEPKNRQFIRKQRDTARVQRRGMIAQNKAAIRKDMAGQIKDMRKQIKSGVLHSEMRAAYVQTIQQYRAKGKAMGNPYRNAKGHFGKVSDRKIF